VKPPDLRRAQAWFATAITTGSSVDDGISIAEGDDPTVRAEDLVAPGPRMNARERLGVYHHAYRARLVECLADDYPALRHALGEETFEQVCHDYTARHPSSSFSLNFFGSRLPAFCRARREAWSLFGSELAALEWAIVEAIHAPSSATSRDFEPAADAEWSERRLMPSPTLRVVRSEHPVNAYYQAFRENRATDAVRGRSGEVTAVARNDRTVWRTNIAPSLVSVLDALVAGFTLGEALATASASETEIATAFRDWMSAGVFVGIE
jgi:hypothetical protein